MGGGGGNDGPIEMYLSPCSIDFLAFITVWLLLFSFKKM